MLGKITRKIYGSIIPILNIDGAINEVMTNRVQKKLQKISVSSCEALAVSINSSSGMPVQSQLIANKLRLFARKNNLKLLTFARDTVTTSGYLILSAGDEVYCDSSSIIGNIGIAVPKYDLKGAIQYVSIQHKKFTSNQNMFGSKLNLFNELSSQDQQKVRQICANIHKEFIKRIKQSRGKKLKDQELIFNGSLFTGNHAKQLGLVDQLGAMVQILQNKYPGCKLEVQLQKSVWNTFLKTY